MDWECARLLFLSALHLPLGCLQGLRMQGLVTYKPLSCWWSGCSFDYCAGLPRGDDEAILAVLSIKLVLST
jgi:hypothetical protein